MFTNENIVEVRFGNPENTTVLVIYKDDQDVVREYSMPARPTSTKLWKQVRDAGWSINKVKERTVEWIKEQRELQYQAALYWAEELANERIYWAQKAADEKVDHIERKTADEISRVQSEAADRAATFASRISDITSASQTDGISTADLYTVLTEKNDDDETVFKFKLSLLEDKSRFEGLSKTEEKAKRREIRKCKTIKEIIKFLDN